MNNNENKVPNEQALPNLGPHVLKLIETKGLQMEEELVSKLSELEKVSMEGSSDNGLVTVTINGNHQLLDVAVNRPLADWTNNQIKLCQLIKEAINDGMYKIDLFIEKEISLIKYKYIKQVIERSSKLEG
ncbi:hypothetical protein EP47_07080 [Legionella norrlandica]|uniref:Nucleoid-associated protein n=1 Tax=Legionella norrlandica TaxID=1498499 RepID=A0A0A2SWX9_9GAMM|nr:YbaB/EbfC family nucleoid-associated protein [Legionella norrlandica]KGP63894.1 hypothetical protein EP47_07080 [Legionella norrlandica]